ncbi:MAG: hypothetical protein U0Y68_10370 [Blastocatellia bacterium]
MVVDVVNKADASAKLQLVLRSVGPAGGEIVRPLGRDEKPLVNNRWGPASIRRSTLAQCNSRTKAKKTG